MDEEAADELGGRERHRLETLAPVAAVVLPPEGDAVAVARDQATVGDGDAVGIAGQIGEHGLRATERLLGIEHPFDFAYRSEIGREGLRVGERGMSAEEVDAAGRVYGEEPLQEQPAEQARQ